jgi:hypothetical protein
VEFSRRAKSTATVGQPTYVVPMWVPTIAFLDSQKAFDVVDHQSLKCKLFYNGINGTIWSLMVLFSG